MTALADHHISRFEVAKDDRRLVIMQVTQYIAQLLSPIQHPFNWQRIVSPLIQVLLQRFTIDEIHHQVGAIIFCKVIVNARQIGV